MKKIVCAALAAALAVAGLSGCLTFEPGGSSSSSRPAVQNASLEGTWYEEGTEYYYDITASGGGYSMNCYKLLRDGSRDELRREMTTFERGARTADGGSSGYLYGYNASRPGWIAYYYAIRGDTITLTSLLTVRDGSTWNSLDEAKAGADKNYPGTVKLTLTKED